jgi:hypothetical protein
MELPKTVEITHDSGNVVTYSSDRVRAFISWFAVDYEDTGYGSYHAESNDFQGYGLFSFDYNSNYSEVPEEMLISHEN